MVIKENNLCMTVGIYTYTRLLYYISKAFTVFGIVVRARLQNDKFLVLYSSYVRLKSCSIGFPYDKQSQCVVNALSRVSAGRLSGFFFFF